MRLSENQIEQFLCKNYRGEFVSVFINPSLAHRVVCEKDYTDIVFRLMGVHVNHIRATDKTILNKNPLYIGKDATLFDDFQFSKADYFSALVENERVFPTYRTVVKMFMLFLKHKICHFTQLFKK